MGLSPFDPAMCATPEAAEAYRQYLLSHRFYDYEIDIPRAIAWSAPIGHMPFAGHRTCAEWDRP